MKKKEKPRRLTLNRETILVLNDPAIIGLARGGLEVTHTEDDRCTYTSQWLHGVEVYGGSG
ncbi:MAG TPA: class I lanthipeptide [Thermoanaerobaculia bacterium]|nr:class I lanthipeptide [Thermoanaerobaculia bacterium]